MNAEAEGYKRVAIVTPYQVVLRGLDSLIGSGGNEKLIVEGIAQTPSDALEVFNREFDIALIDLAIGECNPNLLFVREVREKHPRLPIVTLSNRNTFAYLNLARSAGAQEHLSYHCSADSLCNALRLAMKASFPLLRPTQGDLFPREALPTSASNVRSDDMGLLTPRQREVYTLLGAGKDYHEIASSLGIKQGSVGVYYGAIAERLGCRNVNEVRYRAISNAVKLELERKV